jgi:hypothetical protein
MGTWDSAMTFLLAIFPVLFTIIAIQDWRRTKRGRYLAVAAVFIIFGLSAVLNFVNPNGSMMIALTGVLVVLIAGLVQRSFHKSDRVPAGHK